VKGGHPFTTCGHNHGCGWQGGHLPAALPVCLRLTTRCQRHRMMQSIHSADLGCLCGALPLCPGGGAVPHDLPRQALDAPGGPPARPGQAAGTRVLWRAAAVGGGGGELPAGLPVCATGEGGMQQLLSLQQSTENCSCMLLVIRWPGLHGSRLAEAGGSGVGAAPMGASGGCHRVHCSTSTHVNWHGGHACTPPDHRSDSGAGRHNTHKPTACVV
jgi:hypothetical protein